jgi:hypothetical protein
MQVECGTPKWILGGGGASGSYADRVALGEFCGTIGESDARS